MLERPDIVQSKIRESFSACKISLDVQDPVVCSIPEAQSFLRVIEVPDMSDEELDEAIQWEVGQHIPFGLENMYVDWQELDAKGHSQILGKREVQVGAAQKKLVDSLYNTLSVFPFDIAAFELESQAILRALISPELRLKQGLLIVDLGGSATNVVIHDHGASRFTATLQRGLSSFSKGISEAEKEKISGNLYDLKAKDKDSLANKTMPLMEELVVEVQGIVEFYNGLDEQHQVRDIIITGGGSNMPGLDKAFLKYFDDVQIQRGNPWVNILAGSSNARLPLSLDESVRFTTALGLALRPVLYRT